MVEGRALDVYAKNRGISMDELLGYKKDPEVERKARVMKLGRK